MPDTKITALTALTTADPATDMFPVVDVSDTTMAASGTTKRISINNILACSPSATLASATISGDLTVDTSTLKVDSTNNRVGIGTASPAYPLHVSSSDSEIVIQDSNTPVGSNPASLLSFWGSASRAGYIGYPSDNNLYINKVANSSILFLTNNTTQMTLNSTGLGVGAASPAYKLDVRSGATSITAQFASTATTAYTPSAYTGDKARLLLTGGNGTGATIGLALSSGGSNENYFGIVQEAGGSGAFVWQGYNGSTYGERLRIDSAGNVGVGVTPSAWSLAGYKALELSVVGNSVFSGLGDVNISSNAYYSGGWKYAQSSVAASSYQQNANQHIWKRSTSTQTVGTDPVFVASMTLDASGNLLLGTTDTGSNSGIGIKSVYSSTAPYVATVGSSTSASQYSYLLYSTGGTPAYKFYVSYSGQISATSGTVAALSDARFKENVQDIDVGLGAILALKPRKFDWKAGKGKDIKGDRGFIAQEFEQVFPNLIEEWADPAPEGEAPYKSVRQDLIPVLVKAIQELTARVQTLEAR